MRNPKVRAALLFGALATATGCGGDETSTSGTTTTTTTTAPAAQPAIDIAVDANRDGKVDPADPADQDGEDEWTADHGAAFLPNLDDDDADKVRDVDDEIVNGADDEADLATILVAAWKEAPDGTTSVIHMDALSAANVRLWKKNADGSWALAGGAFGPCNRKDKACTPTPDAKFTTEELRAGVTLGIEALTFRRSLAEGTWNGTVQLDYEVADGKGARLVSDDAPDGLDHAKIRVAPWILNGNLSPFDRVFSSNVMSVFANGVAALATAAGAEHKKVADAAYPDQWTQDWFQTAWTSIPRGAGKIQGMRIANARPWGQCGGPGCLPINWLGKMFLSPGQGTLQIYKTDNSGSTYDSHGNHDLLPPYENGAAKFPLGRILHGSGVLPETHAFYDAQEVQSPALMVKTSWLYVGHVDEVFSFVPAATARGWKVLVGSPKMARQMLLDAQTAGHGAETMFKGKKWYPESGGTKPAEISIDDVLADQDLMAASQDAQAEIDAMVDQLKSEVGLTDDELVEVPYLMEDVFGQKLAYNPGTANILVMGDQAGVPKPWGPVIDGADIFEKDYLDRIGSPLNALGSEGQGMEIHFIDDWDWYHSLDGEVHCGTNPDAAPQADLEWWKVLP